MACKAQLSAHAAHACMVPHEALPALPALLLQATQQQRRSSATAPVIHTHSVEPPFRPEPGCGAGGGEAADPRLWPVRVDTQVSHLPSQPGAVLAPIKAGASSAVLQHWGHMPASPCTAAADAAEGAGADGKKVASLRGGTKGRMLPSPQVRHVLRVAACMHTRDSFSHLF